MVIGKPLRKKMLYSYYYDYKVALWAPTNPSDSQYQWGVSERGHDMWLGQ